MIRIPPPVYDLKFYKRFGNLDDPPPHVGKNSQIIQQVTTYLPITMNIHFCSCSSEVHLRNASSSSRPQRTDRKRCSRPGRGCRCLPRTSPAPPRSTPPHLLPHFPPLSARPSVGIGFHQPSHICWRYNHFLIALQALAYLSSALFQ